MFKFYIECIFDKLGGISAKLKRAWLCIRFAQVLDKLGGISAKLSQNLHKNKSKSNSI